MGIEKNFILLPYPSLQFGQFLAKFVLQLLDSLHAWRKALFVVVVHVIHALCAGKTLTLNVLPLNTELSCFMVINVQGVNFVLYTHAPCT